MVPNLLLQKAGFIQIYHFITDEKGNRTVNREELKVLEKEKPDDYLYEESQVLSWEYLDKRITALEKGGAGSGSIGTETTVGGVKSSNEPNKIKILEDGNYEYDIESMNAHYADFKIRHNDLINDLKLLMYMGIKIPSSII